MDLVEINSLANSLQLLAEASQLSTAGKCSHTNQKVIQPVTCDGGCQLPFGKRSIFVGHLIRRRLQLAHTTTSDDIRNPAS